MADRDVRVVLKVEGDPKNGAAFDDLSRRAKGATTDLDRLGKANRDAMRGGGSGGGAFPDIGSGGAAGANKPSGGGGGSLANIGVAFAAGVGALKLFESGVRSLTTALSAANDTTLTATERNRMIVGSLPLIGSTVVGIRDLNNEIGGLGKAMRDASADAQAFRVEVQANAILDQKLGEAGRAAAEANERSRAAGNIAARVAGSKVLQRELAGEGGPQVGAALAAIRETSVAEEALAAAERDRAKARREADAAIAKARVSKAASDEIQNRPGDFSGGEIEIGKERARVQTQALKDQLVAKQKMDELLQSEARWQQAAIGAEGKKLELSKAELEIEKNTLAALEKQKQAGESAAAAFGKLNPAERRAAADALQRLQQFGADRIGNFEKDLIGRAGFGSKLDEAAMRTGLADPEFRRAQMAAGMQTQDVLEKKILDIKPNVNVQILLDEKKFADAIANILNAAVRQAKVDLEGAAQREKDFGVVQQRQANAVKRGGGS